MSTASRTVARVALAALVAAEGAAALARFEDRKRSFAAAQRRAAESGRMLVVVGDPHAGAHTRLLPAYGCGDVCVDLTACPACPVGVAVDLTRGRVESVPDGGAVVYVSCVFEYVSDPAAMMREVMRMAGDPSHVFIVAVQPWTATAALYPGARSTISQPAPQAHWEATPVSDARKVLTVAALVGLAYAAVK